MSNSILYLTCLLAISLGNLVLFNSEPSDVYFTAIFRHSFVYLQVNECNRSSGKFTFILSLKWLQYCAVNSWMVCKNFYVSQRMYFLQVYLIKSGYKIIPY